MSAADVGVEAVVDDAAGFDWTADELVEPALSLDDEPHAVRAKAAEAAKAICRKRCSLVVTNMYSEPIRYWMKRASASHDALVSAGKL